MDRKSTLSAKRLQKQREKARRHFPETTSNQQQPFKCKNEQERTLQIWLGNARGSSEGVCGKGCGSVQTQTRTSYGTQKYMLKGCQVFLAHVTMKEAEDKSEEKRLEDVPILRDFPEVFPEDIAGLPLTRQCDIAKLVITNVREREEYIPEEMHFRKLDNGVINEFQNWRAVVFALKDLEALSVMVEPEQVKVEQYIRGLSKNIRGDVKSSRPAGIDEVVRMAYQLMVLEGNSD
ncbi:hypothetical protein Tco_0073795 [Tanacetum coccineum]